MKVKYFCLFIMSLCLMGCPVAPSILSLIPSGGMATSTNSAANQDSVVMAKLLSPSSLVDGAINIGKDLQFEVTEVDRRSGTVRFSRQSNHAAAMLIGKVAITLVHLALQKDGHTVDITVSLTGNFGEADQAAVAKVISDFKTAMTKEFAN